MSVRKQPSSWMLAAGLLWLPTFGVMAQGSREDLPPEQRVVAERVEAELSGRIRVGGSVLDAATSKPLAAVRLSVSEGRLDIHSQDLRAVEQHKEEVTGAFRYQCEPCTDVRLRFSKDGYRSETLSFAVAAADGNAVDETRLRVALRPLTEPVLLQAVQGELAAGSDDEARVLAFDPERRKARPESLQRLQTKGPVPPVLRLVAETGGDGKARVVQVTEPKAAGVPVAPVHPRPAGAALDFASLSDTGGGFVRYEPEDPRPRAALQSMRRAPAEGYTDRLELGSTIEPVYFYCRIGSRHGKGYVEAPWIDHQGQVRAHVRLWLNEGGTSLEAAYD